MREQYRKEIGRRTRRGLEGILRISRDLTDKAALSKRAALVTGRQPAHQFSGLLIFWRRSSYANITPETRGHGAARKGVDDHETRGCLAIRRGTLHGRDQFAD